MSRAKNHGAVIRGEQREGYAESGRINDAERNEERERDSQIGSEPQQGKRLKEKIGAVPSPKGR